MAGSSFYGSSFSDLVCLTRGLDASIASWAVFPLFLLAMVAAAALSSVSSSEQRSISEPSCLLLIEAVLMVLSVVSARCQLAGAVLGLAPGAWRCGGSS